MATEKQVGPRVMSLAAQFDDLCRLTQTGFTYGLIEDDIISLLKSVEETRAKAAIYKNEAANHEQRIRELESEIKVKESKLSNLRFALSKEVSTREKFERKSQEYATKLSQVRELIAPTDSEMQSKQKLLSFFEGLPRLDPLEEASVDPSNQSISYEYDKTEEDILGLSRRSEGNRRSSIKKRRNSVDPVSFSTANVSKRTRCDLSMVECNVVTTSDNNTNSDDKQESVSPEVRSPSQSRLKALFKSASEYQFKVPKELPTISTNNATNSAQVSKHEFLAKYVFRPEPCNVCKKSVGGLLTKNLLKCGNCMISIHANCQSQVTVPCIPVIQKPFNAKRGSRLTTVADFVSSSQSPKVPALIYHCCKEIERRGLVEPGLYRIPGSEKDVIDLKNKILRSKGGIPHLNHYDLNTLCGVVKKFLCTLDEPLIQRSLWRDFVEASQNSEASEKLEQMKTAVKEMDETNRETLAYLIVHLQKIADAPLCKMPRTNLAKVFAPTIVGQLHSHQSSSIPTLEKMAVLAKQIAVMEMLLDSPVDFWKNILDKEQPITSEPETSDSSSGCERRTSRAFSGGIVDYRGIITPSKNAHGNYMRAKQKVGAVRPLF